MAFLNIYHDELKRAIRANKLIIFSGAGISKKAGLPLWGELLFHIAERIKLNDGNHGRMLSELLCNPSAKAEIFDALTYIENNDLKQYVNNVLTQEIYAVGEEIIKEKENLHIHSKLWELSGKIITTNYDKLFESCDEFKKINAPILTNSKITLLANFKKYESYLFKIHGDIEEIQNIIFYKSEYEHQYESHSIVKELFRQILEFNTVLFLGTSMRDPYINKILNEICVMFGNTTKQNFILSNETIDTPNLTKIEGDPVNDLDAFISELLNIKSSASVNTLEKTPERMKTIKEAIEMLSNKTELFPDYSEFIGDGVAAGQAVSENIKKCFISKKGPVLFHGRWSTGKTVTALKIGLDLEKVGYQVYYIDIGYDIAGVEENLEREYREKILKRYNKESAVFIIDNIHIFPELSYKLSVWAINVKANCIFIGRPVSDEYSDAKTNYYKLFSPEERASEIQNIPDEDIPIESRSQRISFKPDINFIRSMFEYKLEKLGRDDRINEESLREFSEYVGYNLSFVRFHVNRLKRNTDNIYFINENILFTFLNNNYHTTKYQDVIFIIAALSYLDCKVDFSAIMQDPGKREEFCQEQKLLSIRRNFVYGLYSAEARLILETGFRSGLIRISENESCKDLISSLRHLIYLYLLKDPINIYDVFFSLINLEYEAKELEDYSQAESINEMIYFFLTNEILVQRYSTTLIHRTNTLVKLGYFVKTIKYYNVEEHIVKQIINNEVIVQLVENYIKHFKQLHGGKLFLNWHFKYTWSSLVKENKELAECYLMQFPAETLISYSKYSIPNLTGVLEIVAIDSYMEKILIDNLDEIIGDKTQFLEKFNKSAELTIYFFLHHTNKLSKIVSLAAVEKKIKEYLTVDEYVSYVKRLKNITLKSFITAKKHLGEDYSKKLQDSFDSNYLYRLCFDKPIQNINIIISERTWKRFVNTDIKSKLSEANLEDISTFISSIVLFGFYDLCSRDLIEVLYGEKTAKNIFAKYFQINTTEEEIFNFLWQLKSLDRGLFDFYLSRYKICFDTDFDPLTINTTNIAVSFFFMVYCFSDLTEISLNIEPRLFNKHLSYVLKTNMIKDKILLGSYLVYCGGAYGLKYNRNLERVKIIHYLDNMFKMYERNKKRVDKTQIPLSWLEGLLLHLSINLLGISYLDKEILLEKRFVNILSDFVVEIKEILGILEDEKKTKSIRNYRNESTSRINKIELFKKVLSALYFNSDELQT